MNHLPIVICRAVSGGYLIGATVNGQSQYQFISHAKLASCGVSNPYGYRYKDSLVIQQGSPETRINWQPTLRLRCRIYQVGNGNCYGETLVVERLDGRTPSTICISSGHILRGEGNPTGTDLANWSYTKGAETYIDVTPYGIQRASEHYLSFSSTSRGNVASDTPIPINEDGHLDFGGGSDSEEGEDTNGQ